MIEIIGTHKTAVLVLFNIIIAAWLFLLYFPAAKYPYVISPNRNKFGIILILVFCIFAFWGNDWFHISNFYSLLQAGSRTHMEDIYVWISQNLAPSYLIFRLIVWGGALLFLRATIQRLPISPYLQWYMFVVFGLIWFSYARASLAMAMIFYGLTILCKPYRNKVISYVLGLSVIALSYYFHKSAVFGIGIVIVSLILRNLNRWMFLIPILLFPLLLVFIERTLTDFLMIDANEIEWTQSMSSAQSYLAKDNSQVGIGSFLQKLTERASYIAVAWMCLKTHLSSDYSKIPFEIRIYMKAMYLIVIVSVTFLFSFGVNTSVLSERFFRFSFIPTFILMAYFWQNDMFKKLAKWTLGFGIVGTLYAMLYSFYMDVL